MPYKFQPFAKEQPPSPHMTTVVDAFMAKMVRSALLLLALLVAVTETNSQEDPCCLCRDCEEPNDSVTPLLHNLDTDQYTSCHDFAEHIFDVLDATSPQCQRLVQPNDEIQTACCQQDGMEEQQALRHLQRQDVIPFSGSDRIFGGWNNGGSSSWTVSGGNNSNNNSNRPFLNWINNLKPPSSYLPWSSSQGSSFSLFSPLRGLKCSVPPRKSSLGVTIYRPTNSGMQYVATVNCGTAARRGITSYLSPSDQIYNVALICVRYKCCGVGPAGSSAVCGG